MNPPTATRPISAEPGSTRLPSSSNTAQFGPSMNFAVAWGAPLVERLAPRPTASLLPSESNKIALGMNSSRPVLFSWLHITPLEVISATLPRS